VLGSVTTLRFRVKEKSPRQERRSPFHAEKKTLGLRQTARSASVHRAAVLCGVEGVDGCAVLSVSSVLRVGPKEGNVELIQAGSDLLVTHSPDGT